MEDFKVPSLISDLCHCIQGRRLVVGHLIIVDRIDLTISRIGCRFG